MPHELFVTLYWCGVLAGLVIGLILLVWFIRTLNRIQANTRRTAEDMARLVMLAERAALALPPLPPPPPFRDEMTPGEVLTTIELRGGRLRVVEGFFTGRRTVIDNPLVLDELGMRLLDMHNYAIAQLLEIREANGR